MNRPQAISLGPTAVLARSTGVSREHRGGSRRVGLKLLRVIAEIVKQVPARFPTSQSARRAARRQARKELRVPFLYTTVHFTPSLLDSRHGYLQGHSQILVGRSRN